MGGMATSTGVATAAAAAGAAACAAAAGAAAALAANGGMYTPSLSALRTSPLVTRPPLPVPSRTVASTPADCEMDRAEGMSANSSGTSRSGVAAAAAVGGAAAAAAAAGASSAAAGAAPPASTSGGTKSLKAAMSSSSSTVIMTGTFTAISFPASTRILATYPSSCASNAMVALSVSISATESPAAKASPSPTFHSAMVPASIVGDRAGMGITIW
mmetsp:Transcript_31972/g.94042  ORF Transcript_31972/g.94042 Transcript_31972/m.94042 type:complete len:215 (+) Transcript_31972:781-1425(+)